MRRWSPGSESRPRVSLPLSRAECRRRTAKTVSANRQRDDMIYLAHIRICLRVIEPKSAYEVEQPWRMHRDLVDEGLSIRTPPDSPPRHSGEQRRSLAEIFRSEASPFQTN